MEPVVPKPADVVIVAGADIGQKVDPSAIAVALQTGDPTDYMVPFMGRLPLGTHYQAVAARIIEVVRGAVSQVRQPRWADGTDGYPVGWLLSSGWDFRVSVVLTVDITGLGAPVFELIERELADHGEETRLKYRAQLVGATFTHGDRLTNTDTGISVGKAYLCSRLQALIRGNRVHLARTPEADAMRRELLDYEIRVDTDANDRYGAFRVGSHDDLVTALGLCVLRDHRVVFSQCIDGRTGLPRKVGDNGRIPRQPVPGRFGR